MPDDPLRVLFDCPRFGPLTHRSCLRRQVERKELPVTAGKARREPGPPVYAFCASGECGTGKAIRTEHAALEVYACTTCGTALIGDGYCPTCAARAAEKRPPKPDPARFRAPPQDRIWTEKLPDAPFVPPSAQRRAPVLEAARTVEPRADTAHESPGAGGRDRTGPKEDAAQANAASGMERPAAAGRPGDATGEVIAREMAPAGPAAPPAGEAPVVSAGDDAVALALRGLGYSASDAKRAAAIAAGDSLDGRVRDALRIAREGIPPAGPRVAPDGLPGGSRGSTLRLAVPRLLPAVSAVMTDRTCRCGCGRRLRKNNASGWSGYCNPARYSAGERPPRPSRARASDPAPPAPSAEEEPMPKLKPCPECESKGPRHRNGCSKPPRDGAAAPKISAAAPSPPDLAFAHLQVDELVAKRDEALATAKAIDDELRRRADVIARALTPSRTEAA